MFGAIIGLLSCVTVTFTKKLTENLSLTLNIKGGNLMKVLAICCAVGVTGKCGVCNN